MKTSEKTEDLVKALAKAQGQMQAPKKDKKGQVGQNREYKYADLASIMEAVRKPLSENGLAVTQATDFHFLGDSQKPLPVLITRLSHESGQWQESVYPLSGDGLSPQQRGSELTYARRYSLCALLGLAADDDDDGAGAEEGHRERPPKREPMPTPPKPPAKSPKAERQYESAVFVPKDIAPTGQGKWKFASLAGEEYGTITAEVADTVKTAIATKTQIRVKFFKQESNGFRVVEAAEPVPAGKVGAA